MRNGNWELAIENLLLVIDSMSKRFPCACPRAKQIVGRKTWLGWAGGFVFPGFKGNWVNTYPGGAWQSSASGGAVSAPAGGWNFNVGDLVLRHFPAVGPITDFCTGTAQSYPEYWNVYICTTAITGSATDPDTDTAHFQPWNWQAPSGYEPSAPSGWPCSMGTVALWDETTDSALLDCTITTVLNDFPLYLESLAGVGAKLGYANDPSSWFSETTCQEIAASGAFAYDWLFPSATFGGALGVYDGTAPIYMPPSTLPTASQSLLCFPSLPYMRVVSYAPTWDGSGNILSVFNDSNPSWNPCTGPYPGLVSWNCSSTSLQFEFAAWFWNTDVEYNASLGYFGAQASAPATVTQTLALGGSAYTTSAVAAQAVALSNAIPFSSIAWGTSWTETYSAAGALVSTPSTPSSPSTAITESGAVGTPVPWAVAVNGCPFQAGQTTFFSTQAQVDICGNYCARTYEFGVSGPTACANGNINGYAPLTLSPPATPGQSVAAYNGVQC